MAVHPLARRGAGAALQQIAFAFRGLPIPVIGRIQDDTFILDLRCLDDEETFVEQVSQLRSLTDSGQNRRPYRRVTPLPGPSTPQLRSVVLVADDAGYGISVPDYSRERSDTSPFIDAAGTCSQTGWSVRFRTLSAVAGTRRP